MRKERAQTLKVNKEIKREKLNQKKYFNYKKITHL